MSLTTLFQNFFGNKKEATPLQQKFELNARDPLTEFSSDQYHFKTMLTDEQIALFSAKDNFDQNGQGSIAMRHKGGTEVSLPFDVLQYQWINDRLYHDAYKYKEKMSREDLDELTKSIGNDVEGMKYFPRLKDGLFSI
ncbi:MAG TPA: hypothetical protein VGF14_03165 [Alphaproteobacteria bacterium]